MKISKHNAVELSDVDLCAVTGGLFLSENGSLGGRDDRITCTVNPNPDPNALKVWACTETMPNGDHREFRLHEVLKPWS